MKSVLASLLPMLGALGFFALGLRALLQADRRERAAAARYEKQAEGGRLGGAGVPSGEGPDDAGWLVSWIAGQVGSRS